jgi:hypothetical protein
MSKRVVLAVAVAGVLVLAGCGGDDGEGAPDTGALATTDVTGGDDAPADTAAPAPSGEDDCGQVERDVQLVAATSVILPQLSDATAITDEFILGNLEDSLAAIERLRPLVSGEGRAALDDLGRAVEIVRRGRSGDAEAAAAELRQLTGGVEGFAEWSLRLAVVYQDVAAATGCSVG